MGIPRRAETHSPVHSQGLTGISLPFVGDSGCLNSLHTEFSMLPAHSSDISSL